LYGLVAERRSEIEQKLRFFELEWGAGSPDAVERLLADAGPEVEFAAHHLRRVHDAASAQLSVAEEQVLSETSATSRFAWVRLANELISGVQCEVDGEQVAIAHELGHGLHAVLAEPRGTFDFMPTITIAETAPTFGETLLIERLVASAGNDRERLGIIGRSIDNALLPVQLADRLQPLRGCCAHSAQS
jgi:oligoendopeptidase F